jgi:hypothetical protein
VNHKKLREARIEAIKNDILTKLGFSGVPDVSRINTTILEKRRKIRLYKKSLEETQGKIHELFQEEEYFAKTFHSFTDQGRFFKLKSFNYRLGDLCWSYIGFTVIF